MVIYILIHQTWADSAKLAELFEEFKTRSLTESSASKPRAPGNEVYVSKLGGSSSSGSSGGGSSAVAAAATNSVSKGGKNKWTCSCCKSLVSFCGPLPQVFDYSSKGAHLFNFMCGNFFY